MRKFYKKWSNNIIIIIFNKVFKWIIFAISYFFRDQSFININTIYTIFFCFYFCRSRLLWFFCCQNLCYFHSFLYTMKKKSKKFIIMLVCVQWLYIVALFLLTWLKTTKNVYSNNDNVWYFFIKIISMKRDHENIFRFVSIHFMGD